MEGRFDGRVSDGESDLRDIGNYRRVVGTAFLSQCALPSCFSLKNRR